jgi:hypothetical protein
MDVGMSNSVTTAIRDNVRDSTIGKTRNIGKADRATVEQVCTFFVVRRCLYHSLLADSLCTLAYPVSNIFSLTEYVRKQSLVGT